MSGTLATGSAEDAEAPHGAGRRPPSVRARLLVALALGVVAACAAWRLAPQPPKAVDFAQIWAGARALAHGGNPYDVVGPGRAFEWKWPLYYPLPAVLIALPLVAVQLVTASMLFIGASTALLAFFVTRDGWYRLPLFASWSYVYAVWVVQWSPLLTAAALVPLLGFVFVAKPTIGLAMAAYRPSRAAAIGAGALLLASLAVRPAWAVDWLHAVSGARHFVIPLTQFGGPLLVLALLRWRRPEARLLFAMACVPQTLLLYETIPLFLVPASLAESIGLALLTYVAELIIAARVPPHPLERLIAVSAPVIVTLIYLPCLVLVLRRPNDGPVPGWLAVPLERLVDGLRGLRRRLQMVRGELRRLSQRRRLCTRDAPICASDNRSPWQEV